jgi:predicted secreted hydrolase
MMRHVLSFALCFAAMLQGVACHQDAPASPPRLSAVDILSGGREPPAGFARAVAPRPFVFPQDHGSHPDFQTEWWYFTGQLSDAHGRRFGFQWTLFRRAQQPPSASQTKRASAWATDQLYLAHFAITDAAGNRFHAFERAQRGALGLAGVDIAPFRAYLEDWQATSKGDNPFPLRLQASDQGVALDLEIGPSPKGFVAQGEGGLSRKSELPGGASHYYSAPRLPARGQLTLDGTAYQVAGTAWLDREWSTSVLAPGQIGWDWFSLELEDGRDLMLFQLRRQDGKSDPYSSGTLIATDGKTTHLNVDDFQLEPQGTWQSPRSQARYPASWRLQIPNQGLDLEITPLIPDQELDLSFRYWEGAVDVTGTQKGRALKGRGYMEMVGYAEFRSPLPH